MEFEAAHDGVKVDLPDVFSEDTFRFRADAEAGYLNLDQYLDKWDDWSQLGDSAKAAGQGDDGSIYAVPLGTDTRVIWYGKPVLEKAGIGLT